MFSLFIKNSINNERIHQKTIFKIHKCYRSVINIAKLKASIKKDTNNEVNKALKNVKKKAPMAIASKFSLTNHNSIIHLDNSIFDLNLTPEDYLSLEGISDLETITSPFIKHSLSSLTNSTFSSLSSSFDSANSSVNPLLNETDFEFDEANATNRNLQSYIHVCMFNGNLSDAHISFIEFISKYSSSVTSNDIENCCELLIKGWARKGNTENVKELIKFYKNELKLNPSLHFYEFYLLSLSKQIRTFTRDDIKLVFDEMHQDGFSSDMLFNRSTLNSSEIRSLKQFLKKYNFDIYYKRYFYPKLSENSHVNEILSKPQKFYDPFEDIKNLQGSMESFVDEQFSIEQNSIVKVKPIDARFYDTKVKKSESYYKDLIEDFEKDWLVSLRNGFEAYLKTIRTKKLDGIPFIDFMTIFEPQFYVNLMLEEIRKCSSFSENYSPFAVGLFESFGERLMQQYLIKSNINDQSLQDFRRCYNQYIKYTQNPLLLQRYNPREYWHYLLENGYHYYFDDSKIWPKNILKEIGKDLFQIISTVTKFDSCAMGIPDDDSESTVRPVLNFVYKNHDTYKVKMEIRIHPLLIKLYESASSDIHFEPERLPMLSPPVPWVSPMFGGNLLVKSFIVRSPFYYPKNRFKRSLPSQLFPTYDSLNSLSLCPWIINEVILDLAIKVFQDKGNLDLDIPVSLSTFGVLPVPSRGSSSKERLQIYYKRKALKKEQAEMYSLWVDCFYKLSIGNHLRKRVFWFPMNTDFRSRVYPIPPNFNHLGSDLSRSLLLFAKGKPLGKEGLKWLKIHLINLTGLKKRCSSEDRLKYCDEIIDLIMDSADNPFDGKKWWMESDEKWQTLSCCIDLTKAIRSGDPENYISHVPVHQDGSCNGLQHYAALGRDALGARSVNLAPSVLPQDVYSDVVELVKKDIEIDSNNNVEISKVVQGHISRKIVKQTVMTYVYGVTKYGAKLQVLKKLKEDSTLPEEEKINASIYISEKIFASIRKMFTQTRVIQEWLTNCAHIISNDYSTNVEWITPIGFPVYQSYIKPIKKSTGGKIYPNVMKQKNAFPANFIHSLDSTHMMLTSLECHRNGLTFASVHDCYWTHACDINQMNMFCRRQFVQLHSQPILDNLAKFLKDYIEKVNEIEKISNHENFVRIVNRTIPKGDFDLNSVMNSEFFFS